MNAPLSDATGYALAASLAATLPFLLVSARFRKNLDLRREEVERRLGVYVVPSKPESKLKRLFSSAHESDESSTRASTFLRTASPQVTSRYFEAYPDASPSLQFDRYYAPANYWAPLGLLIATIVSLGMAGFAKIGVIEASTLQSILHGLPAHALTGAIGGYVWALSDVLDRSRNNDLPPSAFYSLWVRLPISAIAAAALTPIVAPEFRFSMALFVGAFPTTTVIRFFTNRVPGLKESSVPEDPPSLQLIQGMTEGVQRRLAEERVERVQHLAYKDPIRLLIRCNMEWDTVIDFIDQALLVQHINVKIVNTRTLGVRGAIDMAALYDRYTHPETPDDKAGATAVVAQLAEVLGIDTKTVLHLAYILWWDPVVSFLWAQWGEVRGGERLESRADTPSRIAESPRRK